VEGHETCDDAAMMATIQAVRKRGERMHDASRQGGKATHLLSTPSRFQAGGVGQW